MIELNDQLRRELAAAGGVPLRLTDPESKKEYVLLEADVFDQLRGDDFQPSQAYAAIDRAFAEGWSDPKMDDYDRYEELKR